MSHPLTHHAARHRSPSPSANSRRQPTAVRRRVAAQLRRNMRDLHQRSGHLLDSDTDARLLKDLHSKWLTMRDMKLADGPSNKTLPTLQRACSVCTPRKEVAQTRRTPLLWRTPKGVQPSAFPYSFPLVSQLLQAVRRALRTEVAPAHGAGVARQQRPRPLRAGLHRLRVTRALLQPGQRVHLAARHLGQRRRTRQPPVRGRLVLQARQRTAPPPPRGRPARRPARPRRHGRTPPAHRRVAAPTATAGAGTGPAGTGGASRAFHPSRRLVATSRLRLATGGWRTSLLLGLWGCRLCLWRRVRGWVWSLGCSFGCMGRCLWDSFMGEVCLGDDALVVFCCLFQPVWHPPSGSCAWARGTEVP